ncbi:hypothetical protein EV192_117101 [Actinocrispum wychmicini]|uniref:HTH cro/C1-type domain-containing protein n=2 Tax=Actinocrispum wychmicini TaxID=1213861 RepID=A0A4R2IPU2_9PSEU|nr:hypothetical protein EV192_117101 [Actinocrispum wychmicini]
MESEHDSSCWRRVASEVTAAGRSRVDVINAVHEHCGISLLRAHRIAFGYTLKEVSDSLKTILREHGTPSDGPAHQRVSSWEKGLDIPTSHYMDALCELYRTRPDRLGFGRDYSKADVGMARRRFLRAAAVGTIVATHPSKTEKTDGERCEDSDQVTVEKLEELVHRRGYRMYISDPADFVSSCVADIAAAQRLLLTDRSSDAQRRAHRVVARNAGFVANRLTDVADAPDTVNWWRIAVQAARRAEDTSTEAWILGHFADAHSCFGQSLASGLGLAQSAQGVERSRLSSAAVFGYLAEAGVQARLGRSREAIDAVRQADRMWSALPSTAKVEDGVRLPEYLLRWHQSNALTVIGRHQWANTLRRRAMELPLSVKDDDGRTLLVLDQAASLFHAGELDRACWTVKHAWNKLPVPFRTGQVPRTTSRLMARISPADASTREVCDLRDFLFAQGVHPFISVQA